MIVLSVGSVLAEWGGIIILVCLSGLFSGLTLGLLSLDKVGLEIVIGSGTALESKYAKRIYPLRKRGNLLLCVLLLGNVAVNSLLSILLADKTSGLIGFLVSTGVIVVFGEIMPQSVCSRYGLAIGYYTVWLVWIFLITLFPIAWPISVALDALLGREIGTIYSRAELKKLLEIHGKHLVSDISVDEGSILSGVLDFSLKEVSQVMTPLDKVFMLEIDQRLDLNLLSEILEQGFSRIPIYEKSKQSIVGLLFVKDLALLNPDAKTPIRELLTFFNRPLPRVFSDVRLGEMLKQFKEGRSHMAVVRHVEEGEHGGDPFYENVGIITLEDVIEEVINDEIVDETDVYMDNKSGVTVRGRASMDYRKMFGPAMASTSASAKDTTVSTNTLSAQELRDICVFLSNNIGEFSARHISPNVLQKLVAQSSVRIVQPPTQTATSTSRENIYTYGEESPYFTLLLSGEIEVKSLHQVYDIGINDPRKDGYANLGVGALRQDNFVADFTATPKKNSRILQITRRAYLASQQATTLDLQHQQQQAAVNREHNAAPTIHRLAVVSSSSSSSDDDTSNYPASRRQRSISANQRRHQFSSKPKASLLDMDILDQSGSTDNYSD